MKKIIITLLFSLLISNVSKAYEIKGQHEQKTAKLGRVYIFLPLHYSLCFDEIYFMAEFSNMPGLEAAVANVYVGDLMDIPTKKGEKPPRPLHIDEYFKKFEGKNKEELKKQAKKESEIREKKVAKMQTFDKAPRQITDEIAAKYNVDQFPSFIYLAPDLNIYNFPFKGCGSEVPVKQFKALLEEFRTGERRGKKIWDLGKDSKVPSRF